MKKILSQRTTAHPEASSHSIVRHAALWTLGFLITMNLAGCQESHQRQVPPLAVQVASVTKGNLPITVDTLGQAVPINSVTITPQVTGVIQTVYVHSGERVRKGQKLFLINPAMYAAEVAQDQSNLRGEIAQAHYDELQVQAYKPLISKDYVTLQTYEEAVASAQTANATVAADQAALQQAELNLSYTQIKAPISGQIGLLTIKTGNLVTANSTTLTTINQTQPIKVQFSLPEKNLPDLRQALSSKVISVQVWNEDQQKQLGAGPVTALDNSVSTNSGTVTAQATLDNPDNIIWSGEYLQVIFTKKILHQVLLIPSLALQEGDSGPFVYVLQKGKAIMQPVTFLGQHKALTAISGAITVGTKVIVGAPARLRPNAAVRPISPSKASGAPLHKSQGAA